MKKGRNKQMTLFLEGADLLSASQAEQLAAKKLYRKAYMLEWKKTAKRKREIRIMLTNDEYAIITKSAHQTGFKPTTYIRELALTNNVGLIPNEQEILVILQKIRMARVADDNESLIEIERLLLGYLHKHSQH